MIIQDPERLDEAMRKARYQLELEGFIVTEEDERDCKAVLSGEMTREELIERLKKENDEANCK